MLDPDLLAVLDRLVQWVVLPLAAWLWHTNKRLEVLGKEGSREMERLAKETAERLHMLEKVDVKLTALVEMLISRQGEDRKTSSDHDDKLEKLIEKLIERFGTEKAGGQQ